MFNYREFEENEMSKIRQRLGLDSLDKATDKQRAVLDALVNKLESMGVPTDNAILMIAELIKKKIAKLEKMEF